MQHTSPSNHGLEASRAAMQRLFAGWPCAPRCLLLQFLLRCTVVLSHTHSPLRGCSAVVGELDDELDANVDYDSLRAAPLKPVAH